MAIMLALLAQPAACSWPTFNPATLRGIKADASVLMAQPMRGKVRDVPKSQWPPTIASLKPASVIVSASGVDISTKPYFDGGWGYFVPRSPGKNPWPERYRDLGNGVYWYEPY